jgi:hypothetical protein
VQDSTPLGVQARTFMDRGEYVPDGLVVQMVMDRLEDPDASKGFILDGFPRTVAQAQALENALADGRTSAVGRAEVHDRRRHGDPAAPRAGPARSASARTTWPSSRRRTTGLRHRRRGAGAPQRRRRGHRPPPARGLPRGDRAAGVLLLGAGLLREVDAQAAEGLVTDRTIAAIADIAS